jgi:D-arabinose 5-phosphate isomerase GutQ/beta-phosphoglucomutase-like phosphatase (HAD superfamily)
MDIMKNDMNNIKNLLEYDLFVFDFDGTIMDTEELHCRAWTLALSKIKNEDIHISMNDYQRFFHSLKKNYSKYYLNMYWDISFKDYEYVYKLKQTIYKEFILTTNVLLTNVEKTNVQLINGCDIFIDFILKNNKKFVIVSNTSKECIDIFSIRYPILKNAFKIYTKEFFLHKKPNPECYMRVIQDFPNHKIIGFEDSLPGMEALYKTKYYITPVFIYNKHYYFNDYIFKKYTNIITFEDYNIQSLNQKLVDNDDNDNDKNIIEKIVNNNIVELQKNKNTMIHIIHKIALLLHNNINNNHNIYLTGMGKSGDVCKKCSSTWQSLSIQCSYIELCNLPHGDFGKLKDGDTIIFISNNGNTDEMIHVLQYIQHKLHKKITTISIVANKANEIQHYSTFTFVLENIIEADSINITPSTSSVLFMTLLDSLGIYLKKNISLKEFKVNHPGGSLGK